MYDFFNHQREEKPNMQAIKIRWVKAPLLIAMLWQLSACTAPAKTQRIQVEDWSIHIECAGPRESGTTIWLEHGIGKNANSTTWDKVFPKLARTHHVCRYDRPGAGKSPPTASYGPETFTKHIAALMIAVNANDQLILVGHSFGGYTARHIAQSQPKRIKHIILLDALSETLGFRAATNVKEWKDVPTGNEPIDAEEFEAAFSSNLAMPVTILTRGQNLSENWLKSQQNLLKLSKISTLIIVEKSGHMIPLDAPQIVIKTIDATARQ